MVTVTATDDPDRAWRELADHLLADPVGRHLAASLLDGMRAGASAPGARIWWAGEGDRIRGLALRTGTKRGLLVDLVDLEAAEELAEAIAAEVVEVTRIGGEVSAAVAFAAAWAERRRVVVRTETLQVFRVLDRLIGSARPELPGRLRLGVDEDRERLVDWAVGFQAEAFPARPVDRAAEETNVAAKLAHERLWVWEAPRPNGGTEAVAMASASPVVGGVSRIQGVYTPPEHRGRGYGAAVTAGVVVQRLSVGGAATCALFADLANPTSNGIYRRLGFRPHHQQIDLVIEPG